MRSGLSTRNLYAVVHYDAGRFCHADNITSHTDDENLMTEFYIIECSLEIGAVFKFCFQMYRRTVRVFLNNCSCQSKCANDVQGQRDNRKKSQIKLMYTTEKKNTSFKFAYPVQRTRVLCTGVRGGPECQLQCRNRQRKLIQQRLMLSFDYRTHVAKTEKRKIVMYKIKKWAETSYKTSEVEKKRKLNTMSRNLRLILSLRA